MLVNIDEIKEGGLRRSWDLPREAVDEMVRGDRAGYRARSALHVDALLRKVERRVLLEASAAAELTAPCKRCLASVEARVPVGFELTYVPQDEDRARGAGHSEEEPAARVAGSFGDEDVNEETYSGKVIDLDPAVREQLLLALPGYPVCQEGCKGLCSVCGANLNERDCGCDRKVPDPRWAGLEKLKQRSKEE